MATKNEELANENSCLAKARPDEPIFVLRANDPVAPYAVRVWVALAQEFHSYEKRIEAQKLALVMKEWRIKNGERRSTQESTEVHQTDTRPNS